jgi:hypothetical protein
MSRRCTWPSRPCSAPPTAPVGRAYWTTSAARRTSSGIIYYIVLYNITIFIYLRGTAYLKCTSADRRASSGIRIILHSDILYYSIYIYIYISYCIVSETFHRMCLRSSAHLAWCGVLLLAILFRIILYCIISIAFCIRL